MDTYNLVAFESSKLITTNYSTSFGRSSLLFDPSIRGHIYNIYGFVRLIDEVVDTYRGADASQILDELENDTYRGLKSRYSANLQIQAFCMTAKQYGIKKDLIKPFFESMRMDLMNIAYDEKNYIKYIYGSADVVGLMCLRVFTNGDNKAYSKLEDGAKNLGSAFQKVNFLRDLAADHRQLKRWYFPNCQYDTFTDQTKQHILNDINKNFRLAKKYIDKLPSNSKYAVSLSYEYYLKLLEQLAKTPAERIKSERISVNGFSKTYLYLKQRLKQIINNG